MHAKRRQPPRRMEIVSRAPPAAAGESTLRAGCIEVDLATRSARRAGHPLVLTPRQFELLAFLVRHAGRVVSRAEIARAVWRDPTAMWTNVIAVAIHALRTQIEALDEPTLLHTVRGQGYRLGGEPHIPDRSAPPPPAL